MKVITLEGFMPSEFRDVTAEAVGLLGRPGRLLGLSKSGYRDKHPKDIVVFNANVFVGQTKVWYGDINLTDDGLQLQRLATELGQPVAVLHEMDGRFELEGNPDLDRAVEVYWPVADGG